MKLKAKDIERLAHLARLGVSETEQAQFAKDVSRIVDWVGILQAAPTQGIAPLAHPNETSTPLRLDTIEQQQSAEQLLANGPAVEDNLFLVPQVLG